MSDVLEVLRKQLSKELIDLHDRMSSELDEGVNYPEDLCADLVRGHMNSIDQMLGILYRFSDEATEMRL